MFTLAFPLGLPVAAAMPQATHAYTCAPVDVSDELAEADAAFVGRVLGFAAGPANRARPVMFQVEQLIKGDLGSPVAIHGLEWQHAPIGERAAILAHAERGRPTVNICVHVEPETLLAVAATAGGPQSDEPPAFLIGGEFGDSRVIALDARGRLVALGAGQGSVHWLSLCPGARRTVEISHSPGDPGVGVSVRDVATLEIVAEVRLERPADGGAWPRSAVCRDAEGKDILVALTGVGVLDLATGELLHPAEWEDGVLGTDVALVLEIESAVDGAERFTLSAIALPTGERTALRRAGEPHDPLSLSISPDGRHAVLVEQPSFVSERDGMLLHLFDLGDKTLVGSAKVPAPHGCPRCFAEATWVDEGNLLVQTAVWDETAGDLVETAYVLSVPDLGLLGTLSGGPRTMSRVGGGLLLGIDNDDGVYRLVATSLTGAGRTEVVVIPSATVNALEVLPSFNEAAGAALLGVPVEDPTPTTAVAATATAPAPATATAGAFAPPSRPADDNVVAPAADPLPWVVAPVLLTLVGGLLATAYVLRRR